MRTLEPVSTVSPPFVLYVRRVAGYQCSVRCCAAGAALRSCIDVSFFVVVAAVCRLAVIGWQLVALFLMRIMVHVYLLPDNA